MTQDIYSLAILPPEPIYGKLQSIIDNLADEHSSPHFKPHITIACEIHKPEAEMRSLCEKYAKKIKPFKVKLKGLAYSGTYYKCVFQLVESPELLEANKVAIEFFGLQPGNKYTPHISLLYSEHDEDVKHKIIDKLYGDKKIDFDIEFDVNEFVLDHSSDDIDIDKWEVVETYKFAGEL